jgi:multidrug efflux system membrane fusion protein
MIDSQKSPPEIVTPAPAQGARPGSRRRWLWLSLCVLLLLGLIAYFLWPKSTKAAAPPPPPIPVVAATSHQGDIGVYYSGLGAVTPLATVTVKSRVDGQLMSVLYREGDTVHQGDLLVEIDDGPYRAALTQAEGQLMRDQAALENARIDLIRYQQLVPQKAIPEQQLATQQATVHQDEGVVKLDEGQIESAKVFTISEDQLQVVLKKMAAGQKLEVDAYSRDAKTKLAQGSLTTLDNQIDPATGTLKLRATFENPKGTLFPNQFVNARLLVEEKHGVTLVSTAAVQRNSQATYVYVVKADSTVTVRPIAIGTTEGDDSEVTSGLAPGEVVVMTGVDKLEEGTKVNAQIPGANPAVSPSVSPPASPPVKSPAKKGGKA